MEEGDGGGLELSRDSWRCFIGKAGGVEAAAAEEEEEKEAAAAAAAAAAAEAELQLG